MCFYIIYFYLCYFINVYLFIFIFYLKYWFVVGVKNVFKYFGLLGMIVIEKFCMFKDVI